MSASALDSHKRVREKRSDRDFAASVQAARSAQLEEVLITNCGYSDEPFQPKKGHKLKEFATVLLEDVRQTWAEFANQTPEIQRGVVATTKFPPPNGAINYFKTSDAEPSMASLSLDDGPGDMAMDADGRDQGAGSSKDEKQDTASASPAKPAKPATRGAAKAPGFYAHDDLSDENFEALLSAGGFEFDDGVFALGEDEEESDGKGGRPPKIDDDELAFMIKELANAPANVRSNADKRGLFCATRGAEAIRTGKLKLHKNVIDYFNKVKTYKRSSKVISKKINKALDAARDRAANPFVMGLFDFNDDVWHVLDSFAHKEGSDSFSSLDAGSDDQLSLSSRIKQKKEEGTATAAAANRSREEELKQKQKEKADERALSKELMTSINTLIRAEVGGAGAARVHRDEPAAPQPATQAITAKFASVAAFLTACGCADLLPAFEKAKMPLKMLPKLSVDRMVNVMGIDLGPAMLIEDEASKYAAL